MLINCNIPSLLFAKMKCAKVEAVFNISCEISWAIIRKFHESCLQEYYETGMINSKMTYIQF